MIGGVLLLITCISQLAIYTLFDSFAVYEIMTLFILTGVGYIFTASTTLAMTEGRAYIGAASAIFGALGFLFGGIVSPLVGIGNILHSTMTTMLVCAVLILILATISTCRKQHIEK